MFFKLGGMNNFKMATFVLVQYNANFQIIFKYLMHGVGVFNSIWCINLHGYFIYRCLFVLVLFDDASFIICILYQFRFTNLIQVGHSLKICANYHAYGTMFNGRIHSCVMYSSSIEHSAIRDIFEAGWRCMICSTNIYDLAPVLKAKA